MTATITEVIPLEGIDLEGAPPCQAGNGYTRDTNVPCGKPAAYRILITGCGRGCTPWRVFICADHLEKMRLSGALCGNCWSGIRRFGGLS